MVHQHFMLVEVFTVAENLILGRESGRAGLLDMRQARRTVRELSERYRLEVDPDALVEDLPVGVQQRVEILKALANDAKYLIFDEPTAVLTPQEIDELIEVMRSLRDEGKAIVFITHKLREVRAIADKITVIRRGKVVGTGPAHRLRGAAGRADGRSRRQPAGRQGRRPRPRERRPGWCWSTSRSRRPTARWSSTISISRWPAARSSASPGSRATGRPNWPRRCSASPRRSGARCGWTASCSTGRTPKQIIDAGLGFVPEDRKHDGFVGLFTVAENLVLNQFDEPPYARGVALNLAKITANAEHRVAEFDIRTQSIETPVSSLSGGNQQKVVLARELSRPLSAPDRQPADPRRRRRRHRVPAPAAGRRARQRHGGADRLHRAGRGGGAGRPDRGDVSRPDRRHRPRRHLARGARSDDGRRTDRGGPGQRLGHHPGRGGRSLSG